MPVQQTCSSLHLGTAAATCSLSPCSGLGHRRSSRPSGSCWCPAACNLSATLLLLLVLSTIGPASAAMGAATAGAHGATHSGRAADGHLVRSAGGRQQHDASIMQHLHHQAAAAEAAAHMSSEAHQDAVQQAGQPGNLAPAASQSARCAAPPRHHTFYAIDAITTPARWQTQSN